MRLGRSLGALVVAACAAGMAMTVAPWAYGQTEPMRARVSVLLDSSGSMLLTPDIITFPETCAATGFNGCTSTGNPSPAQEACNACVAWTIRVSAGCATNWTTSCRTTYTNCYRAVTGASGCAQSLALVGGVTTRGDGSILTPGCDVNGNGHPDDSRLYQAKEALRQVVADTDVEMALWRWAQVEGGQVCTTDAECSDTPGGMSLLSCESVSGIDRCVVDSAILGSAAGQCNALTWNGAASSFSCAECSDTGAERLLCEAYALDRVRTGGPSPLAGTVNCALPTADHRFIASHGALSNNGACDPSGGERVVDFPATGWGENRADIDAWIDHQQPEVDASEITPHGAGPLAAALRDMRASLLTTLAADARTPCRKYKVILVVDGQDTCEPDTSAVAAAAALQDLSFTNARGVAVTDFDVPVHVVGLAACPPAQPNCPASQAMNAIAGAGGTGTAVFVATQAELQAALTALTADPVVEEATCNGLDDDCDGAVDEGFPDGDVDGVPDCRDNCRTISNPSQADQDNDLVGDACDNCPAVFNPDSQRRRRPRCGDRRWLGPSAAPGARR
jgi:hypothetical protein